MLCNKRNHCNEKPTYLPHLGLHSEPLLTARLDPRAMTGGPSPPSRRRGRSLTEGASRIPGTNDSTLRQLKPPHPSHVEGPVSLLLGLATYLNPRPSSLTIPRNRRIKATTNTSRCRLPPPAWFWSRNPAPERLAIKKPVRHSFSVLVFYLTLT